MHRDCYAKEGSTHFLSIGGATRNEARFWGKSLILLENSKKYPL
jgi:hypothetical protein